MLQRLLWLVLAGSVHSSIAKLLVSMARYSEALQHYQASLDIKIATVGPHHDSVERVILNISDVLVVQGKHEEAQKQMQRLAFLRRPK